MLIEFQCTNISEYDAANGRYLTCGQRLVVSDDKIGEMIECSKCKQLIEVPLDAALEPRPANAASQRDKSQPAIASTKSTKPPRKNAGRPAGRSTKRESKRILAQPTDLMTFEFETESQSQLYPSSENRCPKCGSPINAQGKCTQCRYVEQKFESAYLPVESIDMKLAGFQKWFCQILSDGVSLKVVSYAMHIMLIVLFSIVTVFGLIVKGSTGFILVSLVLVTTLIYVGFVYKGYDLRKNPRAKLAWFQKPVWNGLLGIFRMLKWNNFDKRLMNRRVVDKKNAPLVDENLPAVEGIKNCHVLDLEGTLITDRALRFLYGHKNLQCLVLRKTKVTQEGVMRLQQANLDLWIWF